MLEDLKKEAEDRMKNAFLYIEQKVKKIRTGVAGASLVEGVMVPCYGGERELKYIASISCPDARSIMISPWDQNLLKDIESALVKSELGMAPQRSDRTIHLKVPELTEERRKELLRVFKKDVEKSRVEFRQIRQMINDKIKKALNEKELNEDEFKQYREEIQEMTSHFIEKVNELANKKEQELMQI